MMWKLTRRTRHLTGLPPRLAVPRLVSPLLALAQAMHLCLLHQALPINSTCNTPAVWLSLRTLLLALGGDLVPRLMHFMPRYPLVLLVA